MKKMWSFLLIIFIAISISQPGFSQEEKSKKIKQQAPEKTQVKGEIVLTDKGFAKDGENYTFGEGYANLEKAVRKSHRARMEIEKARGNSRTAGIFASLAGGMSGAGLGIYIAERNDETKNACLAFQGVCVGCFGLALIPMSLEKKHIENAAKFYNEDLAAGKLLKN